jgi:hypothetical protein
MASKPKKPATPEAEKYPRKIIPCESGPSIDEKGRSYAKMITSAELAAYRVIGMMQPKNLADEIDTPTFLATLREQAAAVQGGDMSHAEAMLINQASALQALFVRLAERRWSKVTCRTLRASCGWRFGRSRNAAQRWKHWPRSRIRRLSMPGKRT